MPTSRAAVAAAVVPVVVGKQPGLDLKRRRVVMVMLLLLLLLLLLPLTVSFSSWVRGLHRIRNITHTRRIVLTLFVPTTTT